MRIFLGYKIDRLLHGCMFVLGASLWASVAAAGSWQLGLDDRSGLPSLSQGGNVAMSGSFVFWGKNWAWADQQTDIKVLGPFRYSVTGTNPTLHLALAGQVTRASEHVLVWDFDLEARDRSSGVIGGGMSFKFDLGNFSAALGDPQLLPDNLGWSWGEANGSHIVMRFDHPLAAVYFERGQKSEVRAFFYQDNISPGRQHYVATLSASSDIALEPTEREQFGSDDFTSWPRNIVDGDRAPVDLSFLNASEQPAGKHGFLQARADSLVFQDGTPARFWGANLTAYALFATSKEEVRRQAHRLSQLGFNLVRLHHLDSEWVDPNIFGDQKVSSTRSLDASALEKIDWWIKCLRDEGIYVWLDLHVGRRLRAGDGIQGFDEIRQGKSSASLAGYNYVNDSIRLAMQRFDEEYLDHLNGFTGQRYKDDPAIVALLITNENDLTNHFGNSLLPDKGVPEHAALYMREAQRFADAHGLSRDRTWRSWEDGPSKLFLNDLERRFDVDMIKYLREIGARAPIVTTSSWGLNPLSSLPALTVGDLIDVHSYGGVGELERDPLHGANLVHWIAAAHVLDKPLTVTEWGLDAHSEFAPDREDVPLFVAAAASLQGWNALMFFAYSQEALTPDGGSASVYHAYNDPALLGSLPAAALLYRQRHVKEASTIYVFAPSPDMLFDQAISAGTSVALRTAAERGKLVIAMPQVSELPWLNKSTIPAGATVIRDPARSLIPPDASAAVSDTGELRHDWKHGTFTIDTERTQAAMGWIGGQDIALKNLNAALTTRNAAVAVQALDDHAIEDSRDLMISVAARSVSQDGHSLPYYSEPVEGTLSIQASPGLQLSAFDSRTGRMRPQPVSFQDGWYRVALDRSLRSSWLLLSEPRPKNR